MNILVVQESDWIAVGAHDSHHLLERMAEEGHVVRVIDFKIRWKSDKLFHHKQITENYHKIRANAKVTVITPAFIQLPILDYISIIFSHYQEIRKQIRIFKPDIIIGLGLLNTNLASRLAKKNNIPIAFYLLDELNTLVPQELLRPIAKKIESNNMKRADIVISTNRALREYTIYMGADDEKTRIIQHGVDLHLVNNGDRYKIRNQLALADDDVVLFFMGWMYSFSGLEELSRYLVKSDNRKLKLVILGSGDLLETIQQIAATDSLHRIIPVGWKPFSEVPDYLAASDICILPSQMNETMRNIVPIKVLEYMAAGKPVISTELPGLIKEFGLENGVSFVKGPEEVLEKAIELHAQGLIQEYGERAKKCVEGNDWDTIDNNFRAVLADLLSKA